MSEQKIFHCEWCDPAPEGVDSAQVVGHCAQHGVGPHAMVWGWLETIQDDDEVGPCPVCGSLDHKACSMYEMDQDGDEQV